MVCQKQKQLNNSIHTVKFIYNQYLFVYSETSYCKKNNCGVSPYLYSEYATTQQLSDYIAKLITYITNQ